LNLADRQTVALSKWSRQALGTGKEEEIVMAFVGLLRLFAESSSKMIKKERTTNHSASNLARGY
jgi:hypothetical protein